MVADINFSPIFKLFKKGEIAKSYYEIFSLAEELAVHDMKAEELIRFNEKPVRSQDDLYKYHRGLLEFKRKTTNMHIERMINMLKILHKKDGS